VDAIFTAYFVEGRNIGDRRELVPLAVRHGFTESEAQALIDDEDERLQTRDEAARTIQAGVIGVPFYVINDREHISGARHASVFREAIERALAANA
jgi:predicted DsbA family dithiol-disulfide isomerase